MTRAAVFDLDNTLVRGSALFHFGAYAAWRGAVSPLQVLRFASAQARLVAGRGEPADLSAGLAERALSLVAGRERAELVRLTRRFVDRRLAGLVQPAVMAELARHQRRGRPVLLATASPQELADAIAWRLGITRAIGTVAEVVDGCYTGRLVGPLCHGSAKAARVRAALAEQDLELSECAVYSDSVHDAPLLAGAGLPYAVNPDAELERIARRNHWWVLDGGQDRYERELARLHANPFVF